MADVGNQLTAKRLVALAHRLKAIHRPQEGADLLEIAADFSSNGSKLREEALHLRGEEGIEDFDREFRRRNLEASHAIGMAHIFNRRGEVDRAAELLGLAKLCTPFSYLAYAASAYFHLKHNDSVTALKEFIQARRLNPLDFRLAVETSRAALESEEYETALEHAVDAMLLSHWRHDESREDGEEQRRVETLARLCDRDKESIDALIRSRGLSLQNACDHVALSHARTFSTSRPQQRPNLPERQAEQDNLLPRANELRSMGLTRHLSDGQLVKLARLVEPITFEHAQLLFRENLDCRDVYLVRSGTVHIACRTPAGTQILANLGFGDLFGEVSFVDNLPRSASAFGVGSGSAFLIPADGLDAATQRDSNLKMALLWCFWRSLADKIRSVNRKMSELFAEQQIGSGQIVETARSGEVGQRVNISKEDKMELLGEQGLSAHDQRLLARCAREERFPANALIFPEGEHGDSLYVVVEGSVRISRMVPGMGEECLSIIERSEVFGEMALIDEQPRSADARAHDQGCTVLSLNRSLLEEVLGMDPDAGVHFLNLLCRLLCRRLRSMNDRLVFWRANASHF